MPNGEDRQRDRESDLRESIRKLQDGIASNQALSEKEELRMLLGHMAWIVNILNSEYGTIMRMLDRIDKHEKMLAGNGNAPDSISIKDVYSALRGWKKFRWYVGTLVTGIAVAKLFELVQHLGALKP